MKKNKFSWKAFISIGVFYAFIIIFITGIILYLSPAGRIAYWINWKFFGFTKETWQAIHTIFSYLFVILSIFYLFSINWKAFWPYLKTRSKKGLNKKKEFYLYTIFTILVYFGINYMIQPFSSVMDFGEYLTESSENGNTAPPVPHAELLTLTELSEELDDISIDRMITKLKTDNIKFNKPEETLSDIGKLNKLTPIEIYQIITKKTLSGMAGAGIGKKTLEEFAQENNKNIKRLLSILKENNFHVQKGQSLKEIASENDMAAQNIYNLVK